MTSTQASKKTDFTVDFTWWGSLRLAPITNLCLTTMETTAVATKLIRDNHSTKTTFLYVANTLHITACISWTSLVPKSIKINNIYQIILTRANRSMI